MAEGYRGLDTCVHCGFCLPACPTYLATGDENDSPRGRIVLMQALERGEIAATDARLTLHLDNCLGCRGCEPVCPSGVEYGRGLEAARHDLALARPPGAVVAALLTVFGEERLWRPAFTVARWLRRSTLPRRLAGGGRLSFGLGMLAASRPPGNGADRPGTPRPAATAAAAIGGRGRVALFRGCVMDTLFDHVHDATIRTLTVNGYQVVELPGAVCCGALHEHAGETDAARRLAAQNLRAAAASGADLVAVNSAGCGALLKAYDRLLGTAPAADVAARVRDVSELLAEAGPAPGAVLDLRVAYDPPCHLQHAQGIHEAPLRLLEAIPGLDVRTLDGAERCCGSAGLYSVVRPALAGAVLEDKLTTILGADPPVDIVATGNPGCLMQIGAGLLAKRSRVQARHPVELLDWSYRHAGMYRAG